MTRTLLVSPQQRGAYPTITEALADAGTQATIQLAPGTYAEAMLVTKSDVRLVAAEGPETVTIDATAIAYPVIRCHDGTLTLEDLTLNAGDFPAVDAVRTDLTIERCAVTARYGAGVSVVGGSVQLRRSAISGAEYGIVVEEASGLIEECAITDIAADGVIVRVGADPVVRGCTIHGCGRRGIYIYQYGRPTIEGCEVSRTGDAGIAVGYESAPVIRRGWIHDTKGVGISVSRGCAGSIEECRVENTASPPIDIAEGATTTVVEASTSAASTSSTGVATTVVGTDALAGLMAELDGMVGLAAVKAEVHSLIDEIQVNEWRRSEGLSVSPMSHHLIFAGAPGTGKTSVARVYGKLLSALRVLPKESLLEVSRQDLVSHWIGHTAQKTAAEFEKARGGVLFIDEAYTLSRSVGSGGDFGQEAIDTLVKLMEDHRHEIAIIAAGYTNEMQSFLAINPGLASRFSRTIEFPNYTPEELVLILSRMAAADDYVCPPELEPPLLAYFASALHKEHFGNARDARKLFEGMRTAQAQRLRRLDRRPSVDELRTLSTEDLEAAIRQV
ncbi:MAG TPA: right-handed parallel beta-helix repeat-containing protein [Micromonosporaceae bacterium]|nr:right-handed parallel beta-helix repeat-containing protein [Micromonosporaceae bacterium]